MSEAATTMAMATMAKEITVPEREKDNVIHVNEKVRKREMKNR